MSSKSRITKPSKSSKKTAVANSAARRRRYDSAGAQAAAKCSVDKRDPTATENAAPKAPANQLKFVRQESKTNTQSKESKDSKGTGNSQHESSKGGNESQRASQLWFSNISKRGIRGVREEWVGKVKKLKADLPNDAFLDNENMPKNRYDDVHLLDKTRVKVKINPDKDDYIHASRVEVNKDLTYICAQGPLTNTIPQFWLMCIQEDIKVILQLCQNTEDGKEKCAEYMPTSTDWTEFGPVQAKVLKPSASVPSTRKVSKTIVQVKFEGKEYTIVHILYFGWPDHTVAESVATCREVRSLLHKLYDRKPIVVHCSAGIGRTGTFVAIEMVVHKIMNEHNGSFLMVDLMTQLREQRALAVQNDQQYCFIFRCTIDILIASECLALTPEVSAFIQSYDDLLIRKKKAAQRVARSKTSKNQGE